MTPPTVAGLLTLLDQRIDPAKAAGWDPSRLQLGDPAAPVSSAGVCHEVTEDVVDAAVEARIDLLVTYHPLLFRPTVGMEVVVRTRIPGQPSLSARVTEVGPQFEPAPVELQRDPTRPEWVLPVRISFPERLDARPGEPLDLFFKLGANNQRG